MRWRNRLLVVAEIMLVAGAFFLLVPAIPSTLGQTYSPYPTAIIGTAMLCAARVIQRIRGTFSAVADVVYLGVYGTAAIFAQIVANALSMAAAAT